VRLGCYGLNGGKAGQPFCVTVDAQASALDLGGLVDGEPVLAGQIVRVVTTGGGGWGDPLDREPEMVQRDVIDGKVSAKAAQGDYGVVLGDDHKIDVDATSKLRLTMANSKRGKSLGMIDRGPGYDLMLSGKAEPRMKTGV
jgi:N-methylhydantoinase B